MWMRLYLATGNQNKLRELQEMLRDSGLPIEALAADSIGGMPKVLEDQDSFLGNALKKARALAARLREGDWALADDSGLCVKALLGAPGVLSARYAGEAATDEMNVRKLLAEMRKVPDEDRSASFECHLALVSADGLEHAVAGKCPGRIARSQRGCAGFGYDPVFAPCALNGRTFAEVDAPAKAALSHRGRAMDKLLKLLRKLLTS